ncbi:tRNA (adenosine(37)-N6)-dimethylallyltransferase MiaA [Candidatus Falkowbacteria bacterium RIFOXYC2_FULL_47_12]|uniref:tRNA dimethylallyltransferase n=2 Tax=Candidatus Falkowiibacteriota TaxID=1752728 RepID=A0A1F5TMX7_9BACT|nr:MAG: tRNA (adenosine(37)-N6)-dimethylallyltransferase MiaA [Candidatus Falkowbacteria bacterium RIFOXYA2_FULL_47_9]OGF39841.1 MAG: tRNA (adenosine(37)-N6)-dimethylallyltransferase MiaA [Candidatus Falkowbacteria bacterium RIFOXYC2_FULL_47_12]
MKKAKQKINNKLLVIVGPTATGKTKLAVRLAVQFNGEIVSADSRQVYRGMDVGTGKDLREFRINLSIPYHLIDIVSPKTEFNLAKYLKLAKRAIADIQTRGKLPILVGGTGLYVQALVDGYALSGVGPDKDLRARLEKQTISELQKQLKKLDPDFSDSIDNKRYLIRYIEMLKQTKKPLAQILQKQGSGYDSLVLGLSFPREEINKKINKRLRQRIEREGMMEEVKNLHAQGVSWKRLESFGLEYKFVSQYLQGKLERNDMIAKLAIAIHQFAKRQMTWLRRWERQSQNIYWVQTHSDAKKLVQKWL